VFVQIPAQWNAWQSSRNVVEIEQRGPERIHYVVQSTVTVLIMRITTGVLSDLEQFHI